MKVYYAQLYMSSEPEGDAKLFYKLKDAKRYMRDEIARVEAEFDYDKQYHVEPHIIKMVVE